MNGSSLTDKDSNRRGVAGLLASVPVTLLLAGCSLLTIKSPEIPLTPREQEARLLTRDYAAHFATTVTQLIDQATPPDGDSAVRSQALRLKLGAVTEITRTSTGLSPIASLLDTWAFSLQFQDFLSKGAGKDLFGNLQPTVRMGVDGLANDVDEVARKVTDKDYTRYHAFVLRYVEENPLANANLTRSSVLSAMVSEEHDKNSLHVSGTVAQALGDVSDRLRIYSERVPAVSLWQAELALDRAGFDNATYRTALGNIDKQLERISKLADASPALAREAIADLRESLRTSSDRLDASGMQMLRTLHLEREALALDIATERESMIAAFDDQRTKISADAAKITAKTVETSWRELHSLVREALLLTILLAIILLGLPFAAGYWVGRRSTHKAGQ